MDAYWVPSQLCATLTVYGVGRLRRCTAWEPGNPVQARQGMSAIWVISCHRAWDRPTSDIEGYPAETGTVLASPTSAGPRCCRRRLCRLRSLTAFAELPARIGGTDGVPEHGNQGLTVMTQIEPYTIAIDVCTCAFDRQRTLGAGAPAEDY